ncbi:polysaccharide deacetylase family protein [Sulfitobacter sp. HNIBRBA2951]|uniref:polysaccharide deacetylase family protein n=1 Tax=Sulfitobacter aquimarinus TaxID=3158557 RepID=UPI0032DF8190
MKIDWSPLRAELAAWRREKLPLPIWWRDDDAVARTPALSRLIALADTLNIAVHVAVIPDLIEPSLPPALDTPHTVPVVHGWQHISHAPDGAKNAEFGHMRPTTPQELSDGWTRLKAAFGERALPLFVPPWNRIGADVVARLPNAGYRAVSTYGPRSAAAVAPDVTQINTHIDPIFWRGHRGLVDPDTLVAGIAATLFARRAGDTDPTEPLGLLTHHLVHTEGVWTFTHDVLSVLLEEGAQPAQLSTLI